MLGRCGSCNYLYNRVCMLGRCGSCNYHIIGCVCWVGVVHVTTI